MNDRLRQRSDRLAEYLKSIAGTSDVEEFVQIDADDTALESLPRRAVKKSANALERAIAGESLSHDDLVVAEAIVHKTKRPSHRVDDGDFKPFTGEFSHLSTGSQHTHIINSFPSIGRIDLPERSTYGGTGFVVGHNLVMTNRHVAEIFVNGVGRQGLTIRLRSSEIDFRESPDSAADGFRLTSCVMVHPYWDMALFRADLPADAVPLNLSTRTYAELLSGEQVVAVVGYPARDPRNARDVQQQIFGNDFQIKRVAPGRVSERKRNIRSSWLTASVDALAHDASTLGGNSGSAVVNVDNGKVAALHFAGRYLIENYAVPCHELARDPRIVEVVDFDGPLPGRNSTLDRFWERADESLVSTRPSAKVFDMNSDSHNRKSRSCGSGPTSSDGVYSMEIPLRVTVSLGGSAPTATGTPCGYGSGPGSRDAASADTESFGAGFDPDFLTEEVPAPELSGDLFDDAVLLDGDPLIHYTHFSVCQSKSRRLPRFVAWNIDGGNIKRVPRDDNFRLDPRIPDEFQSDNSLYRNNPYDRGHVARRADLNWGPLAEARRANSDSFFFTNITPQHQRFNQSSRRGLWGEMENAIFEDVDVEELKVSVIGGPIFREDDTVHRGVQIPADFWKLIAFRDTSDGEFKVAAYILSQRELIPTEALELDEFRLYQASLVNLADETGLGFDALIPFDTFSSEIESVEGSGLREVLERGTLFSS